MSDNKKRSLQFRRNVSKIYFSEQEVKNAILEKINDYLDGEQILGRYYAKDENENYIVKTLCGFVYKTDKYQTITFIDSEIKNPIWGNF